MHDLLYYTTGFLATLAGGYVLVRVLSSAYYRTKMEHFRAVMREIQQKGDHDNG